ncbi:MAG: hypothetical protein V4724_20700 [Pseudomonadota bacterium]
MHTTALNSSRSPLIALVAARRKTITVAALVMVLMIGLCMALPGHALDLVAFTGITGPMTSALSQLADLGPAIKALVGFVGFVVALISLSALRNFGPVLSYVGLAIFGAVGLVISGAIMGAVL